MSNEIQAEFYATIDKMVAHLDSFIVDGTDQELFIASYLHGHFDLAVVKAEQTAGVSAKTRIAIVQSQLMTQLADAFTNNELSSDDQGQVSALLDSLFTGNKLK